MKMSKFTVEQITGALRRVEAGNGVGEVCRELGITETTFYRWKRKYGGITSPEVGELRQLRDENKRLKSLVADLTLDRTMLQEALKKKF
jgi:putative transposase